MNLNAYILAADPAWIEASVRSYYHLVNRIVVSFDENHTSWNGTPLPVDECLSRLRVIDVKSKMDLRPGNFTDASKPPIDNDTFQRQTALDQASEDADWVLQLDTDEVVAAPDVVMKCLDMAMASDVRQMNFPQRWLYCRGPGDTFLEWCWRAWRLAVGFPGPIAVRPGSRLTLARRAEGSTFHVDVRRKRTPGSAEPGGPVHHIIRPDECVYHFSWIRDPEKLRAKFNAWGHARDKDWQPEFERWLWSQYHPYLACVVSQLSRRDKKRPLRIVGIPRQVRMLMPNLDAAAM